MKVDRPPNRLAKEKSPYLLQHAHNPVDWHPWGDEAFDKARREDKPVFLSIGYSTCHWCHVMERESFENDDVAKLLNDGFISIKVDREERPDVDQVYMAAAHALGQQGGWPLSVWLTPDRRPFFAGTYFPPEDRWGRPGFTTLLKRLKEAWSSERSKIEESGRTLAAHLSAGSPQTSGDLDPGILDRALQQSLRMHDAANGGFGDAPKFPRTAMLELLLRIHDRTGDPRALGMVESQLKGMMRGGIFDHLGGGFARYSTDAVWLAPHFEKMLYDNALLVRAYVQAWQVTRNEDYARIVRETIAYVRRDMTSPGGAFYSAEDADSEGYEGTFYLWTPDKVKALLPGKRGDLFCRAYDVTPQGNFFPHEEREPKGNSILHVASDVATLSKDFGLTEDEVRRELAEGRRILFEARSKRIRPHRDDKVLLGWNGLMISALASAGAALDEPSFVADGERAASFCRKTLTRDGRLLRRYRDGEAAHLAGLEDYAFYIEGLVDLHQATFKSDYAEEALRLARAMIDLFGDPGGGFFSTGRDQEQLIARLKEPYDGATPSGISVAVDVLLRLSALTSRGEFREAAESALKSLGGELSQRPHAYPWLASGLDRLLGPSREIAVAGDFPEALRQLRSRYLRNTVLAACPGAGPDPKMSALIPFLEGRRAVDGKAAVFVCENGACKLPVTALKDLEPLLR